MKRLDRYLARLFLARWLTLLVATLTLMSVLDSLGNSDVLPAGSALADTLRLMVLRLPVLFDRMALFTLLLAVLLTFASLVRHSELVILTGGGLSPLRQVRAMLPVILATGLVSILVIDTTLPRSTQRLADWLGTDAYAEPGTGGDGSLWIAEPEAFVEIKRVDGARLEGITFFERAPEIGIAAMTTAGSARFDNGDWVLDGVSQTRFDAAEPAPRTHWKTDQTPETLEKLRGDPRNLSLTDLGRLYTLRGTGSRPSAAYAVWALDRLLLPVVALVLLVLSAGLMQRFGRGGSGEIGVALGMGIGFCFFILDGVLKTLAASGGVSVWLAVGAPVLALAGVAAWLIHRCERLA